MKKLLTALPLLLMISACYQAPETTDPSVIAARDQVWEEALNARDIDALVALYTSDARVMAPNAEATTGSDAVREAFGAMIDAGLSVDLTNIETRVSGDIAYNVGTYKLMAGDDEVDVGKYIETLRRDRDGEWRLSNDIYNSDMPVAQEGPKTHMMITHEVEDADRWLAAWRGEDGRRKLFKANGAAHVHTFQNADNPNLTGLVIAVNDMDALNAMLASEEGAAAAAADGVDLEAMAVFMETE